MNPYARVVFGVLAIFIPWTIVRAWRKGEIISNFKGYNLDDNPVVYAGAFVVRIGILFFFVALSAGYTMDDISRFAGLSQFPR
jgi:hypothetical protein